jgi:hypothetical protein
MNPTSDQPDDQQIEISFDSTNTSGIILTQTGITVHADMSFDQWKSGLKIFGWMKKKLALGLSDYIQWGRMKFGGDRVREALEQLQFDLPSVKEAVSIQGIPAEMRRPGFTSEHYLVLSKASKKVDPDKLKEFADAAVREEMSPTQLKTSIEVGSSVSPALARQMNHGIVTIQGIRGGFDIWVRRIGGVDGIMKLSPEDQQVILGELTPIVEFGRNLLAKFGQ